MNIIVGIKHVPATDSAIRIATDGKSIAQDGVQYVINPYDEYALEEALRMKERSCGEVICISMGDDSVKESLRKALATGAGRAVHIKDPAFQNADPLTTAKVLAKAISQIPHDLILFGHQGVGTDNSQVGIMVAEFLNIPHINVVVKLEIADGAIKAEREIEAGHEIVECKLPAVILTQKGLNEPRYPSLKGIMAAKKKEILEKTAADLAIDTKEFGAEKAHLKIAKLELPPSKEPAKMFEGETKDAVNSLVLALHNERKIF